MESDQRNLGAVYTKRWVTELILDQVGYLPETNLTEGVLVEPCCGNGAFAVPIVERLLRSARIFGIAPEQLGGALVLADIDAEAVESCQAALAAVMLKAGLSRNVVEDLLDQWFHVADFLTSIHTLPRADWVVGNPPYLRIEEVPHSRGQEYRKRWSAMRGRADVFIGFWQASLSLVRQGGRVGFICADRWMRNQYGRELRRIVTTEHSIDLILDLHDVEAFERSVDAYAAIVVLRAGVSRNHIVPIGKIKSGALDSCKLNSALTAGSEYKTTNFEVWSLPQSLFTETGWVLRRPVGYETGMLAALQTLPDTGVVVRGGIATGADEVFIVQSGADVEDELLRPVVGPADFVNGEVQWRGRYLIYPWTEKRELVSLEQAPRLAEYLLPYERRLRGRHVVRSRKDGSGWWRTIDREPLEGYTGSALLVPDIRERVEPVLDRAAHVPMHSLYRITSEAWDLEVLGAVLLSDFVDEQMRAMSVAMASGRMRVSAQYLRRLRVPTPEQVESVSYGLRVAFRARDRAAATCLVDSVLRTGGRHGGPTAS
jgi:adenine-specific DNA-methyltransferase